MAHFVQSSSDYSDSDSDDAMVDDAISSQSELENSCEETCDCINCDNGMMGEGFDIVEPFDNPKTNCLMLYLDRQHTPDVLVRKNNTLHREMVKNARNPEQNSDKFSYTTAEPASTTFNIDRRAPLGYTCAQVTCLDPNNTETQVNNLSFKNIQVVLKRKCSPVVDRLEYLAFQQVVGNAVMHRIALSCSASYPAHKIKIMFHPTYKQAIFNLGSRQFREVFVWGKIVLDICAHLEAETDTKNRIFWVDSSLLDKMFRCFQFFMEPGRILRNKGFIRQLGSDRQCFGFRKKKTGSLGYVWYLFADNQLGRDEFLHTPHFNLENIVTKWPPKTMCEIDEQFKRHDFETTWAELNLVCKPKSLWESSRLSLNTICKLFVTGSVQVNNSRGKNALRIWVQNFHFVNADNYDDKEFRQNFLGLRAIALFLLFCVKDLRNNVEFDVNGSLLFEAIKSVLAGWDPNCFICYVHQNLFVLRTKSHTVAFANNGVKGYRLVGGLRARRWRTIAYEQDLSRYVTRAVCFLKAQYPNV